MKSGALRRPKPRKLRFARTKPQGAATSAAGAATVAVDMKQHVRDLLTNEVAAL